jgi:hypothetical protein
LHNINSLFHSNNNNNNNNNNNRLSDAELEWLAELRAATRRVDELKPTLYRLHRLAPRVAADKENVQRSDSTASGGGGRLSERQAVCCVVVVVVVVLLI